MDRYRPDEIYIMDNNDGDPEFIMCRLLSPGDRIVITASNCYQPESGELLKEMFEAWQEKHAQG